MSRRGLNREALIAAAVDLIDERGWPSFSMRALAERLEVKTASLYAHVKGMDELLTEAGKRILARQRDAELSAIGDKSRGRAVFALAEAYRRFAREHAGLYQFIMGLAASPNEDLRADAEAIVEPFLKALSGYHIPQERKLHWQRVLRGMTHGFVSQEQFGYFSHYPLDADESYRCAIGCLVDGLEREEARQQ